MERTAADGAGSLRQEPGLRGQAAMKFLHRVDRIAEFFGGVVHPKDADLTVAERSALVKVGGDSAAVHVNAFVTGARLIPPSPFEIDFV